MKYDGFMLQYPNPHAEIYHNQVQYPEMTIDPLALWIIDASV